MAVRIRALSRRLPPPKRPEADPRFRRVSDDLKRKAAKVKQHPTPAKKKEEALAAAKGPPNEKAAGAKANQVDKIQGAPTGKPEPTSFLALLQAEIAKAMPKTLGDTEKFMKGGSKEQLKGGLKGNVKEQQEDSSGELESASKEQPKQAGVPTTPGKAIPGEPAPPPPNVDGAAAMPAPKSEADVSLQDSKQDTDAAMAEAEITPTQLKKANDPRFSAVLTAKDAVGKQADTAPAQFRARESGAIASAKSQASSSAKKGATLMLGVKGRSKSAVRARQDAAKAADEKERAKVALDIENIYADTKASVERKLDRMEASVNSMFDAGVDAALARMTSYVEDKIFDYKLRRYLSIPVVGQARWVRDQFKGLPEEANAFYVQGRNLFQGMMNALVVRVAALVERSLADAKAEVARGQGRIKTYVSKLKPSLRALGESKQKEYAAKFKELEQGIEDRKNQLAQALAAKYKEAFDKADKALKDIQDANKGLVAAFVEKLGEIIKILTEFKSKLMAILRKGADAIKLILADPIGFLSNLIGAIKQGFSMFRANIGAWLIKGIIGWLFGALASAGVTPPADFSLPSVLKLVMQILGITYERMRAKAVKLLGEKTVGLIEHLFGYLQTLIGGGPAALWAQVKGDLASLKDRILGDIKNMIIEAVVKAAITKLLSMFNPAGAIVQAIMAIYNTVMFVIEQAAQIMAFVEAIINSIMAIAQGAIGAAAAKVEQALGAAIPIVIGFLARLIGLGDIPKRVTGVIKKVQAFVDGAIDKFLKKAADFVKKMFGKGGKKDQDKKKKEDEEKKKKWEKGEAAVKAFLKKKEAQDEFFVEDYESGLASIKAKYGFTRLKMNEAGTSVDAAMSPNKPIKNDWPLVSKRKLVAPSGHKLVKDFSKSGNKRVFAVKGGIKRFVYNRRTKAWQQIKDDKLIREAEKGLRNDLRSARQQFTTLIEAGKAASAQGFDAGGIGQKKSEAEERVVVGEVKGGFRKGWQYFALDKFTAITRLFSKNMDTMREAARDKGGTKLVKRFDEAVKNGNITIVIKLVGKAVVASTVWPKLEAEIRKRVKAYIKANYPDVDPDEVIKNIKIDWK